MGFALFGLLIGAAVSYVLARGRTAGLTLSFTDQPAGNVMGYTAPVGKVQPQANWPSLAEGLVAVLVATGNDQSIVTARNAVAAYQQAVGMAVDGFYSPNTRDSVYQNMKSIDPSVTVAHLPVPWASLPTVRPPM